MCLDQYIPYSTQGRMPQKRGPNQHKKGEQSHVNSTALVLTKSEAKMRAGSSWERLWVAFGIICFVHCIWSCVVQCNCVSILLDYLLAQQAPTARLLYSFSRHAVYESMQAPSLSPLQAPTAPTAVYESVQASKGSKAIKAKQTKRDQV